MNGRPSGARGQGVAATIATQRRTWRGGTSSGRGDTEDALWDDLQAAMRSAWDATRHEDRVTTGTPDVSYGMHKFGTKVNGWIELKVLNSRPKGLFKIPKLTGIQSNWLQRRGDHGGRSFVMVRIASERILLIPSSCLSLLGTVTLDQFEAAIAPRVLVRGGDLRSFLVANLS